LKENNSETQKVETHKMITNELTSEKANLNATKVEENDKIEQVIPTILTHTDDKMSEILENKQISPRTLIQVNDKMSDMSENNQTFPTRLTHINDLEPN
jgi:hypothetical protein